MAIRTYSVGSLGPFTFDDGVNPEAFVTDAPIRTTHVPAVGSDILRLDDVGSSGVAAPSDASYVVIGFDGDLSAERQLAVGSSLTLVDSGANANVTLNTIQNLRIIDTPTFSQLVLLQVGSSFVYQPIDYKNIDASILASRIQIPFKLTDQSSVSHIAGYIKFGQEQSWTSTVSTQDAYYSIELSKNGTVAEKLRLGSNGDLTIVGNHILTNTQAIGISAFDERIEFYSAGNIALMNANVGIGTISPAQLFEVATNNVFGQASLYRQSNGMNHGTLLEFALNNSGNARTIYGDIYGAIMTNTAASEDGYLVLRTMRLGTITEAVRILSSGNVGIGLTPTSNMVGLSIEAGILTIKETTTPIADTNYGKVYTKSDNLLYFQDGVGTEHTIAYV